MWAAPPPQRVVFAASRFRFSHAQRVSGLLKNDETRAEVIGKAGRDGGKEPKTRHGKGLYDGKQGHRSGIRTGQSLPWPVQSLNLYRQLALGPPRALLRECLLQPL